MQGGYQRSNFSKWLGLPFTKGVLKHVPMHQNIVKPTSVEKYMIALNTQDEMINSMENFLDGYDGFICPSSAVTAFPHHAPSKAYGNFNIYNQPLKVDQTDLHYYMATQAYTTPFSLTESPVLALPLGLSEEGMPVGVQVVGKRHHDFDVLALGKMLEQYTEKVHFPAAFAETSFLGRRRTYPRPSVQSCGLSIVLKPPNYTLQLCLSMVMPRTRSESNVSSKRLFC